MGYSRVTSIHSIHVNGVVCQVNAVDRHLKLYDRFAHVIDYVTQNKPMP